MSVEDSPEFLKALDEACEKQYRGHLYGGGFAKAHSKDTIADTMEEMQRQRKNIEARSNKARTRADQIRKKAMIMSNPHMREITTNLKRKSGSSGLVCPICGEGDHGNRMNGKPFCFMNAKHKGLGPIPLMTREKAKDWKPPNKHIKARNYTFSEPEGVTRTRPR